MVGNVRKLSYKVRKVNELIDKVNVKVMEHTTTIYVLYSSCAVIKQILFYQFYLTLCYLENTRVVNLYSVSQNLQLFS